MLRTRATIVANQTSNNNRAGLCVTVPPVVHSTHKNRTPEQTARTVRSNPDIAFARPGGNAKRQITPLLDTSAPQEGVAETNAQQNQRIDNPSARKSEEPVQKTLNGKFKVSQQDLFSSEQTSGADRAPNCRGPAGAVTSPTRSPGRVFENTSELLPTPEALSRFMDERGYEKQFIGAVYRRLDPSTDLFGLDPFKAINLENALDQKFTAIEAGEPVTTSNAVPAIYRTPKLTDDGQPLFLFKTPNASTSDLVLRTQEEIELHLLIENHLIAIGQPSADPRVFAFAIPDAKSDQSMQPGPIITADPTIVTGVESTSEAAPFDTNKIRAGNRPNINSEQVDQSTAVHVGLALPANRQPLQPASAMNADASHVAGAGSTSNTTPPDANKTSGSATLSSISEQLNQSMAIQLATAATASSRSNEVQRFAQLQYSQSDAADLIQFLSARIAAGRLRTEHVGGERNNCWIRSFWLAAFDDSSSPEKIKRRLSDRLSDRKLERISHYSRTIQTEEDDVPIADDIKLAALNSVERQTNSSALTLEQNIDIIYQAACDWKNRRLIKHQTYAGPFSESIDHAITVVSRALLLKDMDEMQLRPRERTTLAIEIINATTGDEMGESNYIAELARAIGIDMVVCDENGAVDIATIPGSALNEVVNPSHAGSANGRQIPDPNELLETALALNLTVLALQNKHYEPYLHGSGWAP